MGFGEKKSVFSAVKAPQHRAFRAVLLLVAAFTPTAFATTFVNRSLEEVTTEAPNIARGIVGSSYADWGKGSDRSIYTYSELRVTEVIKGELKENKVLLRQPGGSKDGMEMRVPGSAHFATDEDVVVLLGKKNEDGSYDVPGLATGKYNAATQDNGEVFLVNSLGGGAVFEPNKDAKTLSYNSRVSLDTFRKVAQGVAVPEAKQTQYKPSAAPPPPGATDGHDDVHAPQTAATPDAEGSRSPQLEAPRQHKPSPFWIPVSFVVAAAVAGFVFWKITRGGRS